MYDFSKGENKTFKESAWDKFNKIPEETIYRSFLNDKFAIGKPINSPFRNEKNPSFCFYVTNAGKIKYKDFGSGDCGSCSDFVHNMLREPTVMDSITKFVENERPEWSSPEHLNSQKPIRRVIDFAVKRKRFTQKDLDYWAQFSITEKDLKLFEVSSLDYYVEKENGFDVRIVKASIDNPIYCYKIYNKFKFYRPLSGDKFTKWRTNCSNSDIQGFAQLKFNSDTLIVTKSLKDVIVLNKMGFEAISPGNEGSFLSDKAIRTIKSKYSKVILLYDNDKAGLKATRKLFKKYNFDFRFISRKLNAKDVSDLVKEIGYEKAETYIKKLLA